jgi:hypothetical protein
MATERAERAGREAETAAWEDTSDERERLADERERLAEERERLADERERLADHDERIADRVSADSDGTGDLAQEQLARADARVQRALAEQERARVAVVRASLHDERVSAATERRRSASASDALDDDEVDEVEWAWERQGFVAEERERLAGTRESEADVREELARQREQTADVRDRAARAREEAAVRRIADATGLAAGLDKPTERARRDLAELRDAGRRQRAAATDTRRQAAADRADAGRRRVAAGATRLPNGGYLAAQFSALTRELFASHDLFEVAERVVDLTIECIPGVVASGVTFFEGVRPMAHVATDDVAQQLDAYQLATEEGPIGESLIGGEPVSIGDLAGDPRWPSLRAMAAQLGITGVAACGLTVRRDQDWQPLGALTVYAEAPGAFDEDVGEAVSLFAAHLAVVAAFDRDRHDVTRREAALHRALGSRDVIGQAKGILMERRHVPAGEAFDILRRASQRLNVRLQELATRFTETGDLPE